MSNAGMLQRWSWAAVSTKQDAHMSKCADQGSDAANFLLHHLTCECALHEVQSIDPQDRDQSRHKKKEKDSTASQSTRCACARFIELDTKTETRQGI